MLLFLIWWIFQFSKYGVTTAWTCIKAIHRQSGLTGFYKGITASYFGLSETVIHFVIYEFIKSKFDERRLLLYDHPIERTTWLCFYQSMSAGAISKAIASVLAYPHGNCQYNSANRIWLINFLIF